MKSVAFVVLCGAAFWNIGWTLKRAVAETSTEATLDEYLLRFEECRTLLPPHGRVGYIGEVLGGDDGERESLKNHLFAQYALAPLVLERGTTRDLVVANFTSSKAAADRIPREFSVIRDFGNGVMLLRRRAQ